MLVLAGIGTPEDKLEKRDEEEGEREDGDNGEGDEEEGEDDPEMAVVGAEEKMEGMDS